MEPTFEFNVYEVEVTSDSVYQVEIESVTPIVEVSSVGLQGPVGPQGPAGADGGGVPNGGTTGDVLMKSSPTDQDVAWASVVATPNIEFPVDPELIYANALI